MEKVIIVVDAGGTKTKVSAFNVQGEIVEEFVGGSGSPAALKEKAFENIRQSIDKVFDVTKNKYQVNFIQMGISGLGVVPNKGEYEEKFSNLFNCEVSMESDAILALYSIIEDKYDQGVLILSGTGSATCGINGTKTRLILGWGHLLTETGSSYSSVKMLVSNMITLYEQEDRISDLGRKFMDYIGIDVIEKLKIFMYSNTKADIAKNSIFLSEQAMAGDHEAYDILKQCAIDLANHVQLQYKHLKLDDTAVLGLRGSFIQKAYRVKEEFVNQLIALGIKPNIVDGKQDPIYGGYYMAKKKGKI